VELRREQGMRRRDFLAIAAAQAIATTNALADQAVRRVAVVMGVGPNDTDAQHRIAVFKNALGTLGWVEGKNIEIAVRWASGDRKTASDVTDEVLQFKPDVFLAHNTIVVEALVNKKVETPVVFVAVFDPVRSGFVKSIGRPGGNITGFTNLSFPVASKWMEFLQQMKPSIRRAILLWCPATAPYGEAFFSSTFEPAAPSLRLTAGAARVGSAEDIEKSLNSLDPSVDGLTVLADPFTTFHRKKIIELASWRRIVTVYPWSFFVRDGGLMSYGVNQTDMFRRSASYVSRILRGERPGDLPVQAPLEFEFGINLATARNQGFFVPQELVILASEIVDQ
jgi:putative ABC transport system substrate-binding protein